MVHYDVNGETGSVHFLIEMIKLVKHRSSGVEAACTHVLVAQNDVDAVCSHQILSYILSTNSIAFCTGTVSDYDELRSSLLSLQRRYASGESSVNTVILLSCGAVVDLPRMINSSDFVVIVLDSHRPIHISNIVEPSSVIVFDDDLGRGVDFPSIGAFMSAATGQSMDGSSGREAKRARRSSYDSIGNGAIDVVPESLASGDFVADETLERYYAQGFYAASPTALFLYTLASELGCGVRKSSNLGAGTGGASNAHEADSNSTALCCLWGACVSVAAQGVLGQMSRNTVESLARDVDEGFLSKAFPQVSNQARNQQGRSDCSRNQQQPASSQSPIRYSDELEFPFARHWSILDAMYHHPSVYAKLDVYRETGKKVLQQLLAYVGMTPEQYMSAYISLPLNVKEVIQSRRFRDACYQFGLSHVARYDFVGRNVPAAWVAACSVFRAGGKASVLGAAAAHSNHQQSTTSFGRPGLNLRELTASDFSLMLAAGLSCLSASQVSAGNVSLEALLETGAQLSRAVAYHSKSVLDRRMWKTFPNLRFTRIDENVGSIGQSSLSLRYFASFLVSCISARSSKFVNVPYLLCVRTHVASASRSDPANGKGAGPARPPGSTSVVGGPKKDNQENHTSTVYRCILLNASNSDKCDIPLRIRAASEASGAFVDHKFFDPFYLEIDASSFEKFVNALVRLVCNDEVDEVSEVDDADLEERASDEDQADNDEDQADNDEDQADNDEEANDGESDSEGAESDPEDSNQDDNLGESERDMEKPSSQAAASEDDFSGPTQIYKPSQASHLTQPSLDENRNSQN